MKKIYKKVISIFLFVALVCGVFFSFVACSGNEIEKLSKNLTTYSISAVLDDEEKTISATEKVRFVNNSGENLDHVCFHLYPRAFREGAMVRPYTSLNEASCFPNGVSFGNINISEVFVNNLKNEFEIIGQDEDILKISLENELDNKQSVDIDIKFELIIPNSTHRLGWFKSNINLGNWYPIVCYFSNGEFDMSPYYATGDPFCSDLANYDIEFSYPTKYKLCSTGNINIENNTEMAVAKITAKAVRDFAMCLSSEANIKDDFANGIKVSYMACFSDEEIMQIIKLARKAIEFFSKMFGEYPYNSLMIANTPFLYGGMEYPNMVFVSDSINSKEELYKVVVHEIAHQWWYGIVGNNETKEAWLDESLSEYSSALFFKEHSDYGISYDDFVSQAMSSYLLYVDVLNTIKGEVNTKMDLAVNEYQNDYEYSYMVYIKGIIMFDSLKNMVGENKVMAGLKRYYTDNKFKIATKRDFFEAFKRACHKDLDGFFEGFLDGSTIISNIN